MLRLLVRTAVAFPYLVLVHDKGFDGLFVIRCDAGVGVGDQIRQTAIIGWYAQYRFLAAQRLIELRGQHAVGVRGGQYQNDTAAPYSIAHFVMRNRVLLRRVNIQYDVRILELFDSLFHLFQCRFLPVMQVTDIRDDELLCTQLLRIELPGVVAVIDHGDR